MTFEHQSKSIINGVNDNGAVPYGFRSVTDRPAATLFIFPFQLLKLRVLYSSIFGSGEPMPSTSCGHHSLILVIQALFIHLFLA